MFQGLDDDDCLTHSVGGEATAVAYKVGGEGTAVAYMIQDVCVIGSESLTGS